jgi:hypothetical protein
MDQPVARRQPTGDMTPQGRSAQERAEIQLQKLAGVSLTVIAAIDETHGQAEAYCAQGNRSAGHQRRLCERAALVLSHFDEAAIRVQGQAFDAILNRQWEAPPPVTRIIEVPVPQKGLIPRLFGK